MNRNVKKIVKGVKGMSLLEILVVVTVFAILAILTTRAVLLTLKGSKKSESTAKVRANVDYALAVMERNLRNADFITNCTTGTISYVDEQGDSASFSYIATGSLPDPNGAIASGSARLTSSEVDVTSCIFTCSGTPFRSVVIEVEAQDAEVTGSEGGQISVSTEIHLRTY